MNPFAKPKELDPRCIERPVKIINKAALDNLLLRFSRLEEQTTRNHSNAHCVLLLSPDAGYGKSHLSGRLFEALQGRATLVYVRPFETVDSYWGRLLLAIVQEMGFPEFISGAESGCSSSQPTQLDALARGVLARLLEELLRRGGLVHENPQQAIDYLAHDPVGALDPQQEGSWANSIGQLFGTNLRPLREILQELLRPLHLQSGEQRWMPILYQLAVGTDPDLRDLATSWLAAQPMEDTDAKGLGVEFEHELSPNATLSQQQELAKSRIMDLCLLARLYRPFLLCFDQTELYGDRPQLARAFGSLFCELAHFSRNLFILVTANTRPWETRIAFEWEKAYLDNFDKPYVHLDGVRREEAEQLVAQRLQSREIDDETGTRFADQVWYNDLFPAGAKYGAREFLEKCRERWDEMITTRAPVRGAAAGASLPTRTLRDNYDELCESLRKQPKLLCYNADVLEWILKELAKGLESLVIEPVSDEEKGVFRIRWKLRGRTIFFGFEPGKNHNRWAWIARESYRRVMHARRQGEAKSVFLRTGELIKIPKPNWGVAPAIDQAKHDHLHILELSSEQVVKLYAAHRLTADAVEGDSGFNKDETLGFLRDELADFWAAVQQDLAASAAIESTPNSDKAPPVDHNQLVKAIEDIIRREKFLDSEKLHALLGSKASEERMFAACRALPGLQIHSGPHNTILQWQSTT